MEQKTLARGNNALDLLRLACAFGVVWTHAVMFHAGRLGNAVYALAHAAPPVFLLISGYYYRGAGELTPARARGKFFRFLKMALKWLAIYFAYTVFLYALPERVMPGAPALGDWLRSTFAPRSLFSLIVLQAPLGVGVHLWYLSTAAVAALMMMFFERLRLRRWRLPVAVGLLAALLLIELVVNLRRVAIPLEVIRNAYLIGFPMMLLGDWMRDHRERLCRLPVWGWSAIAAAALLFSVWEFFGSGAVILEYGAGTLIGAFALVALCLHFDGAPRRPWASFARRYSQDLYLGHMLVIAPLQLLAAAHDAGAWAYIAAALAACVVCLLRGLCPLRTPAKGS